jgi:two-component system, sensor histidine kinase LadS
MNAIKIISEILRKISLYTILSAFIISSSFASVPLLVNDAKDQFFILSHDKIDILIDKTKNIRFSEILKSPKDFHQISERWLNKNRKYVYQDGNGAAYWMRFTVRNHSKLYRNWLIEFLDFNTDKLSMFIPAEDGTYHEYKSGSAYQFGERTIGHRNFEFNIPFSEKPLVCYIRIEPGNSNVFAAELKSYESFITYSLTEYYLLGLFYGFILLMTIYNLVLYINTGEKQYIFYVFYVFCVGLSSMCQDGTGFQYIWPGLPQLNEYILTFSLFGMVLWTMFYSKWFLNTRFHAPLINKLIEVMTLTVLGLLVFVQVFTWDYTVFLIPGAAIPLLVIYITGIRIYMQGFRPAWYFLMAYTFFFFGFAIRMLTFFNIIGSSTLTVYSYNIAVLLEMMLFSIAIGDKIRTIKQEKVKALMEKESAQQQIIYRLKENEYSKNKINRELEARIAQQTIELNEKNRELIQVNEKLKEFTDNANQLNVRLDIDNEKLQENVKDLAQERILMKDVTTEEFHKIFPDENSCFRYLADMKWKDNYQCKKCRNENFGKGKTSFSRRCTKCNYEESATNGTLFHRLKFPISKAFYMVYLVSNKNPDITSDELSEILSLRRETCWSFKKKITLARKDSLKANSQEDKMKEWTSILNYQKEVI